MDSVSHIIGNTLKNKIRGNLQSVILGMTEIGMVHVKGKNAGNVVLYALSTCGWCRKTKEFLNELGVAYDYVDTDLLAGKEKDIARKEVQKWNPRCSFPTLVINDKRCVVGFDKNGIRDALEL